MHDPVPLRHQLGIVIYLANMGLIHRTDHRPKCETAADAVIEWLDSKGVVLDWGEHVSG